MSTSVRLFVLRRVKRLLDKMVEVVSHGLGEAKVHSQPGANADLWLIAEVNYRLAKGQIDNSVELSAFNKKAGDYGSNIAFNKLPLLVPDLQGLSGLQNNFVGHQQPPQSGNHPDLAKLNAKCAGVQS